MLLKYWNVPEPALSEVMTGRDGAVRDFSVPPGHVQPELIKRQNIIAEALFRPPFLALWRAPGSHSCNQSWIWLCRASAEAGSRWSGTRPAFRGHTRRRARRKRSPTPARWAQRQDVTSWTLMPHCENGSRCNSIWRVNLTHDQTLMNPLAIEIYSDLICPGVTSYGVCRRSATPTLSHFR